MPSPRDAERIKLFRHWLRSIGDDLDEAHRRTGVARRTLERLRAGKQPPPVRLLEELSRDAADRGHVDLAGALAGAATVGMPNV